MKRHALTWISLSTENHRELLALHELSCTPSDYRAFVRFVLSEKAGYETLIGEQKRCAIPLGADLREALLQKLAQSLQGNRANLSAHASSRLISELILSEYQREPDGLWATTLQRLSSADWKRVANLLYLSGQGDKLLDLAEVHRLVLGSAGVLAPEILPTAFSDEKSFLTAIRHLGFGSLLRISELNSRELFRKIGALKDSAKGIQALSYFSRAFEPSASWDVAWDQFTLLHRLESRLRAMSTSPLPIEPLLAWRDSLQRKIEAALLEGSEDPLDFLAKRSTTLDSLWLRLRLEPRSRENLSAEFRQNFSEAPALPLERILWQRLKAHLATTPEELHLSIQEFCAVLTDEGLTDRKVDSAHLNATLASNVAHPGCYRFAPPENSVVKQLSLPRVRMAFDSALILPEHQLHLSAGEFDGSLIDLSAVREHAPLPAESHPDPSADAITFPFVVGYKVSQKIGIHKGGVHYFVVHLNFRPALDGTEASALPAPGFAGGSPRLAIPLSSWTSSLA